MNLYQPQEGIHTYQERLRKLSNVIQALENLIIQCGEGDFFTLKEMAKYHLSRTRQELREIIHSSLDNKGVSLK